MALLHYLWSRVASSNATADSNVNWSEGQAPSSVNDSARAMMASAAGFRDDIAGAIVTGGTSTAYTVASYQIFDTLAHMNGQMIAFTPHATNGNTVTLNVDSLGAKPLRSSPAVELLAGTLILGTPYVATYNNSDAVWYLHNFYGNPYNVPLAGGMDFWGTTVPNSSFAFPIGQAISRATYSALFAIMSTTYGVGDGSTTFNLPDKRGRISAMKETSATLLTSTYFIGDSTSLGVKAGFESETMTLLQTPGGITAANLASIALAVATNSNVVSGGTLNSSAGGGTNTTVSAGSWSQAPSSGNLSIGAVPVNSNNTGAAGNGTGAAAPHPIVPPTIICNYIMRII